MFLITQSNCEQVCNLGILKVFKFSGGFVAVSKGKTMFMRSQECYLQYNFKRSGNNIPQLDSYIQVVTQD